MPNFHLHWLVGWRALDGIPGRARDGRDRYLRAAADLRSGLHSDFDGVKTPAEADLFFDKLAIQRFGKWRERMAETQAIADDITCFSAFMLGACGPDFWTLPSLSWTGTIPDFGSHHFDLGHYNRTHQQFRISVAEIGNAAGIQAEVERSYFMGMAAHIGADLVLHQLVNVYAGAYTLLVTRNWNNEHEPALVDPFNTHNKVEHFWDSVVRYDYLGDLEEGVFGGAPQKDRLGFPLAETLVWKARKIQDAAVRGRMLERLVWRNPLRQRGKQKNAGGEEVRTEIRVRLELPLVFPAVACDRILASPRDAGALRPFIYDRVVHPDAGAYPKPIMYSDAISEKTSGQMSDDSGRRGRTESRKLRYFSTARNSSTELHWSAQTYVTYEACPDLARLREAGTSAASASLVFGKSGFYDVAAVSRFADRAVVVAKGFANRVQGAYRDRNPDALGDAGRFWNLDTGLGLKVDALASHTDRELVTQLDFVHVLEEGLAIWKGDRPDPGYRRGPSVPGTLQYLEGKQAQADVFSKVETPAFPVRKAAGNGEPDGISAPFESLSKVTEPDTKAYLDRIRLQSPPALRVADLKPKEVQESPKDAYWTRREKRTEAWLDAFFETPESARSVRHPFGTVAEDAKRRFQIMNVKHRLTLELRVPVLDISDDPGDKPAFFLYGDDELTVAGATSRAPADWLADKHTRLLAFSHEPDERQGKLSVFRARILVNPVDEGKRAVEPGRWNNVVPYAESKQFYGRNFAVATGRRHVLRPVAGGRFDPTADFARYDNVSPTEHVFFTLYPLVRTPAGVVDAFSKETVTRDQFAKLRKITGLEWKKVILFYDLRESGAVQLYKAFVDGLDVPPG